MRPRHRILNRQQVHRPTTSHLQQHVPLADSKREVTAPTPWAVLLVAAAEVTSIHAARARLDGLAPEQTIRKALYASPPEFAELRRRLNQALAGRLPRAFVEGFGYRPETAFGTMNTDILERTQPGYRRPNFCDLIAANPLGG